MREVSIIVYRDEIIDIQIGNHVEVPFNFEKVWSLRKIASFIPEHLIFYHSHPSGLCYYSEKDRKLMEGFSKALGCPIYFGISIFDPEVKHRMWVTDKEDIQEMDSPIIDDFIEGILKKLSKGR